MKVLLISPLGFPVNNETRYAGIEQLVLNFAKALKGHSVTVLGHFKSQFPEHVTLLPSDPTGLEPFAGAELKQYQVYQNILRDFDVIHDFSHQHFASRYNPNLPSLNIFWHAPNEIQYEKAHYNIIGLSKWACRMFKQYYHREARFQQTIALDTNLYCPVNEPRNDRFLTIGVMSPQKGNLEAAQVCKKAGVPLDICGSPYDADYVKQVEALCDEEIKYHGEVTDMAKLVLMKTCKALIYCLPRPEVTSHKVQEAMLCGAPVITQRIGALPEIVTHGVDGYLCDNGSDYLEAIRNVHLLHPEHTHERLAQTYSIENVVAGYDTLYERVANGLRWK